MTRNELDRVLELHGLWLDGEGGERANLSGANLSGADLERAYLNSANLSGADVSGADLRRAYLSGANLYEANLTDAYLYGANLSGAELRGAKLGGAYLRGVRTNWFTRMTARGAHYLTAEQRAELGTQPPPRAGNARRAHSATQLARRLKDQPG